MPQLSLVEKQFLDTKEFVLSPEDMQDLLNWFGQRNVHLFFDNLAIPIDVSNNEDLKFIYAFRILTNNFEYSGNGIRMNKLTKVAFEILKKRGLAGLIANLVQSLYFASRGTGPDKQGHTGRGVLSTKH